MRLPLGLTPTDTELRKRRVLAVPPRSRKVSRPTSTRRSAIPARTWRECRSAAAAGSSGTPVLRAKSLPVPGGPHGGHDAGACPGEQPVPPLMDGAVPAHDEEEPIRLPPGPPGRERLGEARSLGHFEVEPRKRFAQRGPHPEPGVGDGFAHRRDFLGGETRTERRKDGK